MVATFKHAPFPMLCFMIL